MKDDSFFLKIERSSEGTAGATHEIISRILKENGLTIIRNEKEGMFYYEQYEDNERIKSFLCVVYLDGKYAIDLVAFQAICQPIFEQIKSELADAGFKIKTDF